MNALRDDEAVVNLLTECGETNLLSVSFIPVQYSHNYSPNSACLTNVLFKRRPLHPKTYVPMSLVEPLISNGNIW